ncbi:YrhK family protein [Clavibacter sp. Sh2141]|uniref:YrhK family protein n=1 Tax=unclassified Clavibacter TaxID=2626594 RepID=UPI0039BC85A6
MTSDDDPETTRSLSFTIGSEELVIRHKYEVASIVNDVMVAAWFVVGSVLFFSESTTTAGTWLFLLGSVQLMIRPLIRLSRRVHLTRVGSGAPGDTGRDY